LILRRLVGGADARVNRSVHERASASVLTVPAFRMASAAFRMR
jgi:hypothetical protein